MVVNLSRRDEFCAFLSWYGAVIRKEKSVSWAVPGNCPREANKDQAEAK